MSHSFPPNKAIDVTNKGYTPSYKDLISSRRVSLPSSTLNKPYQPQYKIPSSKMKLATISSFLALAMSVAANQMTMAAAKDQCTTGDIACCDSAETLSGDGILGNLLAKGALNGLLGNDDAACAKTSLLGDVNVLGMHAPIKYTGCEILTIYSYFQEIRDWNCLQEHYRMLPQGQRKGKEEGFDPYSLKQVHLLICLNQLVYCNRFLRLMEATK